jgi:hypothetical protein
MRLRFSDRAQISAWFGLHVNRQRRMDTARIKLDDALEAEGMTNNNE